jgi:cystathionine beta-lyase
MKKDTILTHAGRHPEDNYGIVNPPVYHASTVTFPTLAAFEEQAKTPFDGVMYGRMGTPTSFAFEEAVAAIEGGHRSIAVPSGLAAIAVSMTACLKSGDHALVTDNAYGPTRVRVSDGLLARAGVEVTYFDPAIGGQIKSLFRPNTKAVYLESPGSLSFEMMDVPAIAAAAKEHGATVMMDNTWASPYFFRPLEHGVDIVIEAATKYIVGHSDAMLGVITVANRELFDSVKWISNALGNTAAPDDCYLGLRGLRTLSVRLDRHQRNARILAEWLQDRDEVERVLYPPLENDPGHFIWKRDFSGGSGLFGVLLKAYDKTALAAMLDGLQLFGMGASWGGFESLVLLTHPEKFRTVAPWNHDGHTLRIHAGLEDPDDLIDDLREGFDRLNKVADGG